MTWHVVIFVAVLHARIEEGQPEVQHSLLALTELLLLELVAKLLIIEIPLHGAKEDHDGLHVKRHFCP